MRASHHDPRRNLVCLDRSAAKYRPEAVLRVRAREQARVYELPLG